MRMKPSEERSDELRILLVATVETLHNDSNIARYARRSSLRSSQVREEVAHEGGELCVRSVVLLCEGEKVVTGFVEQDVGRKGGDAEERRFQEVAARSSGRYRG